MATIKKEAGSRKNESSKKAVKTVKVEAVIPSVVEGSVKSKRIATGSVNPRNDKKTGVLAVPVYSLLGKEAGSLELPKSIFGVEINKALLSQALRVYLNNQKGHFSNTKTRGEVTGSTRKIYKQKGTGRARHGGITAPIFVGGGIALGPKVRKVTLELPKKMKKASLISALSQKLIDKGVYGISGLEKISGKTAELAKFIKTIEKKSALIVTDKISDLAQRASTNLKTVNLISASELNALEVIKAQSLIFTKEAVAALESRIKGQESSKKTKEVKKEEKT